jgi:hypothetical protein
VLASTGVIGHSIVVVLLVGSGLAIAVSLVIRPPRDVPAATVRLVLGLSAMFVLAPSTRFGYFIYPAAMVLWLLVSQAGRRSADQPDPALLADESGILAGERGILGGEHGILAGKSGILGGKSGTLGGKHGRDMLADDPDPDILTAPAEAPDPG